MKEPDRLDDEIVNDLAVEWYFLNLHYLSLNGNCHPDILNELIEIGLRLKCILKYKCYTYLDPMNICVDEQTFFDIWLDADTDICVGELYSDTDC